MNDRQTRNLASYEEILTGLADRAASLSPEALAVVFRLKATVDEIRKYGKQQYLAAIMRHVTSARFWLDQMRQEEMLPLARLARRIFAGEPAIQEALRVPHKRAPTEVLLAAAVRIVKVLRPHRALLAASHIDPARLDRLQAETRQLKKSFQEAYASVADRAVPTRRLPELFASAHAEVLVLDALIPGLLPTGMGFDWEGTRRVRKRMGRPRTSRRARRADPQAAT